MAKSFNNLRVGKRFKLINFSETFEFEVVEIKADEDCLLKDLNSLDYYHLMDLIRYGKGEDFDLIDL